MSHPHTVSSRKLREDLTVHAELASSHQLKIERLEKELGVKKKKLADEKAIWDQKIKDVISQRDSIKRTYTSKGETSEAKELIIHDWKDSQASKDFVADMGLLGVEVAIEVTLGKLREALGKASCQLQM